jgi:hypothetical protein
MDHSSDPNPVPLEYATPQPRPKRRERSLIVAVVALITIPLILMSLNAYVARRQAEAQRAKAAGSLRAIGAGILLYGQGTHCASNLRALGASLRAYADAHSGLYPDSLQTLIRASDVQLVHSTLICPATSDVLPEYGSREALARQLTARGLPEAYTTATTRPALHLSYIYCAAGLGPASSPDAVVAYEPLCNHEGSYMCVLFASGKVDMIYNVRAAKLIAELQAGHNPPRAEMLK